MRETSERCKILSAAYDQVFGERLDGGIYSKNKNNGDTTSDAGAAGRKEASSG